MPQQLSFEVLESLVFHASKPEIDSLLESLAPNVQVVGSQFTEDGIELVLEGSLYEIASLEYASRLL